MMDLQWAVRCSLRIGSWPAVNLYTVVITYKLSLLFKNQCSAVAEMDDRLATIDMDRKLGGGCDPSEEMGAGSPSNTKLPGPRPISLPSGILIHPAVWPQQTWAENWGAVPFGGEVAGSTSNTVWPGPRSTSTPSFVLIYSAVWPQ